MLPCPECRQKKCLNCTVTVLCEDENWRVCPCAESGHGNPDSPINKPDIDAALTYAGTSGHSGTDTSQERAEREDRSGETKLRQQQVKRDVEFTGSQGMTVKDLRKRYPHMHHGQISSALTNLHRAGQLIRLADKREGCKVYVRPAYVGNRVPESPSTRPRKYPYPGLAGTTILGPECFVSEDGSTISYKGENYYRSPM